MKKILPILFVIFSITLSCAKSNNSNEQNDPKMALQKIDTIDSLGYVHDSFQTPKGRQVDIVFIKHGSLMIDIDNYLVYVDPVGMYGNDFSVLPKADMILVTHEHHDHFDPDVINELTDDSTLQIMSRRVTELFGQGQAIAPGDTLQFEPQNFTLIATPAYNISEGHLNFHPKDRKDVGFVFDIDGLRIYVAGDTEDIHEMGDLKDIDVAFLPVNQPYTMTPEQAIRAIETIHPKVVYPYHYGETDLTPIVEHFKGSDLDVRIRQMQ